MVDRAGFGSLDRKPQRILIAGIRSVKGELKRVGKQNVIKVRGVGTVL